MVRVQKTLCPNVFGTITRASRRLQTERKRRAASPSPIK